MPKIDMDYSKTIIYKIVCNDLNITDTYVGHTTNFTKRKYGHKSTCNNENDKYYNLLVYQTIRDNGNWDNWCMIEIEKFPCNDKNEARARERYWIETLNSTLNSCIPNRTQKEWTMTNKEHIAQYQKEWKQENKEHIKLYRSQYINCECGGKYGINDKARHFKSKKHLVFFSHYIVYV